MQDVLFCHLGKRRLKQSQFVVVGANRKNFLEAIKRKVDLYLTGDTSELYHLAKDGGMNVIFAGHYATETVGLNSVSPRF